ncbi:MAG: hypothetical protein ACRCYP_03725 [Alphaproteobacteria bacterium]
MVTSLMWATLSGSDEENTPEVVSQKIQSSLSAIAELQSELNSLSPEDLEDFVVRDAIGNIEKSLFRQLRSIRSARVCQE